METPVVVHTSLTARFLIEGTTELSGRVVRMAESGVLVQGISNAGRHTPVVFYLETGERFEGLARQVSKDLVCISVKGSPARQKKLAACMEREKARAESDDLSVASDVNRHAPRYEVESPGTKCVLPDGRTIPCRVLNISLGGMGIAMDGVARIGDVVRVGKVSAKVVHRTPNGYGLEFITTAAPTAGFETRAMENIFVGTHSAAR